MRKYYYKEWGNYKKYTSTSKIEKNQKFDLQQKTSSKEDYYENFKLRKYAAYYNSADGKYYLKEWDNYKKYTSTSKIEKNQKFDLQQKTSSKEDYYENPYVNDKEDNIKQDLDDSLVKAIKQFWN